MVKLKDKGIVFNIQQFSLHDGPGIRTLVFLKGCPLKCQWCSNPESQSMHPELLFKQDDCLGGSVCGLCLPACPRMALKKDEGPDQEDRICLDRSLCDNCGVCTPVCPVGAVETAGREMTVDEVIREVQKDGAFHSRSGGGITVSGGEPIAQAGFVHTLFRACKAQLMDTAIETCGYANWENLEAAIIYADLIHYDIKTMDADLHKRVTGRSNGLILANLTRLSTRFTHKKIIVRTPVIPGVNDTEAAISAIRRFIQPLEAVIDYQLMPYHRFGESKYAHLGKTCPKGGGTGARRFQNIKINPTPYQKTLRTKK